MNRVLIYIGVGLVLIGIVSKVLITLGESSIKHMNDRKAIYEKHLGEKVEIDGDTLTIVDFDQSTGVFILSNDVKINMKLVK